MSEVFAQPHQRLQAAPNPETIPKLLDENTQLVSAITEHFNKGRMNETIELQKQLHRNLVYLTCLAFPNKPSSEVHTLIPVSRLIIFYFNTFMSNLIKSPETSRKQHQIQQQQQQAAMYGAYPTQPGHHQMVMVNPAQQPQSQQQQQPGMVQMMPGQQPTQQMYTPYPPQQHQIMMMQPQQQQQQPQQGQPIQMVVMPQQQQGQPQQLMQGQMIVQQQPGHFQMAPNGQPAQAQMIQQGDF